MIKVRPAAERGHGQFAGLDTHHSFSFGDYSDPAHMGYRVLRVINEDRLAPGGGFPTHPHQDMEIVTYVLEGALRHRDSLGTTSVIRPGDVQRMSAGTGVRHSEFNDSATEPVHFLQIWLLPSRRGLAPGYAQQAFPATERDGRWRLLLAPDGAEGALTLNQNVRLFGTLLAPSAAVSHRFAPGRQGWLQVARGEVQARSGDQVVTLGAGDGAALVDAAELVLQATQQAEVLLFDLP